MALRPISRNDVGRTLTADARRGRRLRLGLAPLTAIALLAFAVVPVDATFIHTFSVGEEKDLGYGYTGMRVQRSVLSTVVLTGCPSWPAYDTMWVKTADGYTEIATAYKGCEGIHTIFGIAHGYNWEELADFESVGTSYGAHTFKLSQDSATRKWSYIVDGFNYLTVAAADSGTAYELDALLESYDDGIYAPVHNLHDLKYERSWSGNWVYWTGKDDKSVDNPPLCGRWALASSWRVAEGDSCS